MYRKILLFVLLGFSVGRTVAQQSLSITSNAISSTNTSTGKFYYANLSEPPRAIEFKERTVTASQFLTNINQYFNIPAEFTFVETESNTDNLGMRHHYFQQYYRDIALEGLGYRVHEKDGFVTSANGRAVRNVNGEMQVSISEEMAFQFAVKHLNTNDKGFRPGKKLIVSKRFTFSPESFAIAFQFDIDVSLIEQWRISIDARNGQLINKVSLVNSCGDGKEIEPPLPYGTGTGISSYYGNRTIRVEKYQDGSSRLVGQTEHGGSIGTYDFQNVNVLSLTWFFEFHKVYDFYSSDNTYNNPYHKPAISVQWAAEQVFEYYFNKHNRNSFDNNGTEIKSYVHVGQDLNNAFWTRNLMAFGDGSDNNPLVELDVVGHELTHGVTQYEAGLQYYNEPGALNESFSDILGKAIEFDTFGDTATWQLAKYYRDGGLRDLSNPNLKNQPDTYGGDMWYTGDEDYGGVHTNSGVQNFWFYLLCNGGSGVNDQQTSYAVNSIGMDAAAKIVYRNLSEYLSHYSDYLDSRIGSLLAAADLYGKNSVTYKEVDKAWDAVGVIDEPIIRGLEVYDITATTVRIKGALEPRGNNATYHFEYGTTPAFGNSTPPVNYTDKVHGILTGLQSSTKYYLRLVATNENGSSFFPAGFTTISLAPMVKIKETIDVTETTATLYGHINPNSLTTSFYFEYGLTPALGLVTSSFPLPGVTDFMNVSAAITHLQPRKTYYYRLVATNSAATSRSESVNFFTAVKPVITAYTPATAHIGTEVTITGTNFNPLAEKNTVSFGATRATIISSSTTQIKVRVPAGASFGSISVFDKESGLIAKSVQEFTPTFTGGFNKGDLQLRIGSRDYIYKTLVQDMDGDNKPDIVAHHYLGFSVFQNVNQGGDLTEESFVKSTFNSEYTPNTMSLADVDGNGLMDVVASYQDGIRIYPNLSITGYVFFGTPVDLPGSAMQDMVFEDFDMDGRVDIAGIAYPGGTKMFTIIRNQNPKGSLSSANFEERPVKALTYYVDFLTTADVNNDGAPDVTLSAYGEQSVSMLTNYSSPGLFEFDEITAADPTRGRFARYVAHDLNQDGWKDIAGHSPYEVGNLSVLENKGTLSNPSFGEPVIALNEYQESDIQPGDINGDGKVDLVVGTDLRTIVFLENQAGIDEKLSTSTFTTFEEFGVPLEYGAGSVETSMTINDLNGDGRPEVISVYSYYFGPHTHNYMEIWQNAPANCLDPSLITVVASRSTATIVLPPNTTADQFDMEYAYLGSSYWTKTTSTTLDYLNSGWSYQLRVRAKCYLGYTDYHYINFATDCVDTNNLTISSIGVNNVELYSYYLGSFEIEYSPAGKSDWIPVPQYSNQILNLSPGTNYDLRVRGRCDAPTSFIYKQFTTLCPKLGTLTIGELTFNRAVIDWTSSYADNAILEYSGNNIDWILIDGSRTIFPLTPGMQYFVRGRLACTNINSDFLTTSFITPCPRLSTLNVDMVTHLSARVNWHDESNTGRYTVTYGLSSGGTVTTVETGSASFTMNNLTPGTHYKVTVAPYCISAKEVTTLTFSTVCYVPFDLSASAMTHTTVDLSWRDNIGSLPYTIDYSVVGSQVWHSVGTKFKYISLTELRPATTYEARVHINCVSEVAPYVSLQFETDAYEATAFAPNPTDNKLTIYPSKNLIGNHFSLQDNTGRIVAEGKLLDYTIYLSNFSPGMYTLKIEGEKTTKVVKY